MRPIKISTGLVFLIVFILKGVAVAETSPAMAALPLSDSQFSQTSFIELTSAQSFAEDGRHIINRIALVENKNQDSWIMKQKVEGNSKWNTLLLIVDKKQMPYSAYYYELNENKPKYFSAVCFHCHSSGPRKIRPLISLSSFTPVQKDLLNKWNAKIESYRVVKTPQLMGALKMTQLKGSALEIAPALPIVYRDSLHNEVLHSQRCYECHNSQTGLRSELKRLNLESIDFLVEHNEMPLNRLKLSKLEKKCLQAWVHLEAGKVMPAECQKNGEVKSSSESKYVIDSGNSSLQAEVTSRIGNFSTKFKIENFLLAGSGECEGNRLCSAEIIIGLKKLATGISLRDEHLQDEVLETKKFPVATLSFSQQKMNWGEKTPQKISISIRSQMKDIQLPLTCKRSASEEIHCEFADVALNLADFDLALPQHFGAKVEPIVAISGQLLLKPQMSEL